MIIDILTLFPGMFDSPLKESMLKRAIESGAADVRIVNIRDFAQGRHAQADDRPYGGGSGMVMKVEPVAAAVRSLVRTSEEVSPHVILLTPQGRLFNQARARELARRPRMALICGHYEGVDERVSRLFVQEELSVGDYVLTGGETAALVVMDAVVRLLPGVLGNTDSLEEESFSSGLIEYPQYTRPREFEGHGVPEVLLSGDHAEIARWRKEESMRRTMERRPDLVVAAFERDGEPSEVS